MSSVGNISEKNGTYTLAQMIDLAVGTPEIGHVDFNMLQGVLHVLAQRTHNKHELVEIRWGDIIPCRPTFIITEQNNNEEESNIESYDDDRMSSERQSEAYTKINKEIDKLSNTSPEKSRSPEKPLNSEKHLSPEKLSSPEKPRSPEKLASPNRQSGHSSPDRARIVAERVSRTKGQDSGFSVGHSPQQGGSEAGNVQEKLTSGRSSRYSHETSERNVCDCKDKRSSKVSAERKEETEKELAEELAEKLAEELTPPPHQSMWQDSRLMDMESNLADLLKRFNAAFTGPVKPCGRGGAAAELEQLGLDKQLVLELDSVRGRIARVVNNCDCADQSGDESKLNLPVRLNVLERKVKLLEIGLDRQGEDVNEQLGAVIHNKTGQGTCKSCPAFPGLQGQIERLATEIAGIKEYMVQLEPVFGFLDTTEDKHKRVDVLIEQVELLKMVKADREDVESWLADKADTNNLLRKVSYDAFDSVCVDLQNALRGALNKLTAQETLWQQALDDVQREIENKLDKGEMPSLKSFVNERIKLVQERLRELANMKQKEASSAKSKYLKDLNCLSCDADVVMLKEDPFPRVPLGTAMPPGRAMRPYHSSQLEAVRKKQKPNKEGGISLCMRFCGGSHTRTTPAQRVARAGHFLTMFGPQVHPIPGTLGPGLDGRMYNIASEAGDAATVALQPLKNGGAHTVSSRDEMEMDNEKMEECRCNEGKAEISNFLTCLFLIYLGNGFHVVY